jgi:hypothetical protein
LTRTLSTEYRPEHIVLPFVIIQLPLCLSPAFAPMKPMGGGRGGWLFFKKFNKTTLLRKVLVVTTSVWIFILFYFWKVPSVSVCGGRDLPPKLIFKKIKCQVSTHHLRCRLDYEIGPPYGGVDSIMKLDHPTVVSTRL